MRMPIDILFRLLKFLGHRLIHLHGKTLIDIILIFYCIFAFTNIKIFMASV